MYLEFIERVLLMSGNIAKDNFGKVDGLTKGDDNNQVLTETDLAIAKYILGELSKEFHDYNIIDEEAGFIDKKSRYTWVVDPIDGTSNFAAGLPQYGIFLGLLDGPTPVAGGIALPSYEELYLAEKGKGATLNGKPTKVCDDKMLSKTLVAYLIDANHKDPDATRREAKLMAEIILNIRNLRTSNSAYDAAQVAKGSYGGVVSRIGKIWDYVAACIVMEEAGAKVTDIYGEPLDFSDPLNREGEEFTCCIAPPVLHEQLQNIIRKIGDK